MFVTGRLTICPRKLPKLTNIVFGDIHHWDAPDYSDAFIVSAEWEDGTSLTDEELDKIEASDVSYYLMERETE
jgi:hypothetical protein